MKIENDKQLKKLREELDKIDDEIALLILKRLEKSFLIGKIKKSIFLNTYTPERERDILKRIVDSVDDENTKVHLKRIFERIIDESRSIQRKIK